jgi:glucose-1-phosphate adenylyltransferase
MRAWLGPCRAGVRSAQTEELEMVQDSPSAATRSWPDVRSNGPLALRTYALVLAGGRGTRLHQLTEWRAKPAVPFGGSLRIIDFPLSNCVNSGLRRIGVLTQYKAQSLIRHIERGWGFLDAGLGEYVDVVPAQQRVGERWYSGTANAVYQNIDIIGESRPDFVLILAGDHVYKMNYELLLADHVTSRADVTVACVEVPVEEASRFGVMVVDREMRVRRFIEKPHALEADLARSGGVLGSMGIYVFNTSFLCQELERDAGDPNSAHDFGRDLIPSLLARCNVVAHHFGRSCIPADAAVPYWRDVGTVDAYWEANMDLVRIVPTLDLYDTSWAIRSREHHFPPAKFVLDEEGRRGFAVESLVTNGCIVSGAVVRRSILFTGVRVGEGSLIEDSLLLPGAVVGRDVYLRRAIIDKRCVLPDGFRAGLDPARDRELFHVTDGGVTLVVPEMLGQRVHLGPDRGHDAMPFQETLP